MQKLKLNYIITIIFLAAMSSQALAQDAPIFPKGEKAPNVHHVGDVWLKELHEPDSVFNYSITVATFDAGGRLNWHKHPGGQILLITAGTGYYQERGKPKQILQKGDVVKCLPGVHHRKLVLPTCQLHLLKGAEQYG